MVTTVNKELIIHEVPLEKISTDGISITIELDDENEVRWRLVFCPFQDIRITTEDCYGYSNIPDSEETFASGRYKRYLLEIHDSERIAQLRTQLVHEHDDFLVESRLFFMHLGDNMVEIVAWDVEIYKKDEIGIEEFPKE